MDGGIWGVNNISGPFPFRRALMLQESKLFLNTGYAYIEVDADRRRFCVEEGKKEQLLQVGETKRRPRKKYKAYAHEQKCR